MAGETDLERLLASLQPRMMQGEFVFCSVSDPETLAGLEPLATFREQEGLSVLLERGQAEQRKLAYGSVFRGITLTVHSSLDAVGLTAAVASRLADEGIPANVIAACFHDHVFVPSSMARRALNCLQELQRGW